MADAKDLESAKEIRKQAKKKGKDPDKATVDVNLAGEGKKNVGDKTCGYFDMPTQFSYEEAVRSKVQPMVEKWDMAEWRRRLVALKKKPKEMYVLSQDPFDTKDWASFPTRYIASLIYHIYPDKVDPKTGVVKETHFHLRQVHYHLLQAGYCFPVKKKGDPTWELIPYDGKDTMSGQLETYLKRARYARLIPLSKQVDMRTTSKVEPRKMNLERSIPKDEFQFMGLTFKLSSGDNLKVKIETPVIVFFTEKSEITHVLEELAERYYVAYFVGQGYSSPSNTRDIYNYIKAHGKTGIILTLTDYDKFGQQIAHTVARHIQYNVQSDPDEAEAPNIVVYPFKITKEDADIFTKLGLAMGVKESTEEVKGKKITSYSMFYELIALEMLAVFYGKSLEDYLEGELQRMFFYDVDPKKSWLVKRDTYQEYFRTQKDRMYDELTVALKEEAKVEGVKEALEEQDGLKLTPSTSYRDFEDMVRQRMKEMEGFKLLRNTLAKFKFYPDHLSLEQKHPLADTNLWGFREEIELDPKTKTITDKYDIGGVKINPMTIKDVEDNALLWLGDTIRNYEKPTTKMNAWIKKNEKDNPDFKQTSLNVFNKHIATLTKIYDIVDKDPKAKKIMQSIHNLSDTQRKEQLAILSNTDEIVRELGVSPEVAKAMKVFTDIASRLEVKRNKWTNWKEWAEKNPNHVMTKQDEKGDKSTFQKYLQHKIQLQGPKPKDLQAQNYWKKGYTIQHYLDRLYAAKTDKEKKQYEDFLRGYFDWAVSFWDKEGKTALTQDYHLEADAKKILKRCLDFDEVDKRICLKIDDLLKVGGHVFDPKKSKKSAEVIADIERLRKELSPSS